MRPIWRNLRRSVTMKSPVPATSATGTSSEKSKVRSLATSADPTSAPRTASWPVRPPTTPDPAKEDMSSVTAVELWNAIASAAPTTTAIAGRFIVRRNRRRSTSP